MSSWANPNGNPLAPLGPDQLDAQYEDAKNQQAFLEGRISEIERTLENVAIIDEASAAKS